MSTLLTVVTGLMVFFALVVGVVSIYQSVTDSAVAPDLVGLAADDAKALVKRAGLNWQQTDIYHDKLPSGTVVSQIPEPDAAMRKGDSVVVTVSMGPTQLATPDVVGLMRAEATARLKDKGLSMVVFKAPSTQPVDTVIGQNPLKGEPCVLGQEIEVTVSGGSTLVPDLTDSTYEEALRLIKENNLTPGQISYGEVAGDDKVGKVLAQNPAAGTMAVLDTQVALTLGIQGKAFHADMNVDVPAGAQSVPLRVTLVENGEEVEQYSGMTTAGDSYAVIIPVSSALSGPLTCRVYINGELLAEQQLTLQ